METPTKIAQSLKEVVALEFKPIFRRPYIKDDLIIGFVGERGGGKSGSGVVLSLIDFMFSGWPCFSNMQIGLRLEVDDETAQKYGITKGGIVSYRSKPLDMAALLRFDESFRGSLIFLDEINVEVSEARRAMSNTNLFSNRLAQELRHLESSIIYTTLSEMSIDGRLRDITDLFVRCEETAYFEENIKVNKPRGIDFKWTAYYMNRCFDGHTYDETRKPAFVGMFHFKPWRGVYDDKEFQGAGMTKYGVDFKAFDSKMKSDITGELNIKDGPVVEKYKNDWSWFEPLAQDLLSLDNRYVPCDDFFYHPEIQKRKLSLKQITVILRDYFNVQKKDKVVDGIRMPCYVLPEIVYSD